MLDLCLHNVCVYFESFDTVFKYFAIRNPETPSSTPQHHRDRLGCQEQDARVMNTPQHCCLSAQSSSSFVVNAPLAGGIPTPPPTNDPFLANASVAGGTWQLLQAPVNPPLLSLEDIQAQANFHAQNLYGPGLGRGRRHERGIANSNSPRILSLDEVRSIHNQLSTPPPSAPTPAPANQFAGLPF